MSEIKLIKNPGTIRIVNGADNRMLVTYYTRRVPDWSRGKLQYKEAELFRRDGMDLIVPSGMARFMGSDGEIDYAENNDASAKRVRDANIDWNAFRSMLPDILITPNNDRRLRPYQVDFILDALQYDRGMAQIATGAGKTLIIGGYIKSLEILHKQFYNEIMTSLVLVPSSHLLHETSDRLEAYGCKVNRYYETREIKVGYANVGLVASMLGDIEKSKVDPKLVDIVVVDEAHHATARTYYDLITNYEQSRYVLGLSGSLLDEEPCKYNWNDIQSFNLGEARLVSIFSNLIAEINYEDLVNLGYLTDCVVYQVETNVKSDKSKDFVKVAPETIESEERLELLADTVWHSHWELGYERFMAYVRTRESGERFLKKLHDRGLKTMIAYGGRQNAFMNDEGVIEYVGDNALFPLFASGEYSVLIGTTAVEEGVDIPECDAIVNVAGGQSIRQLLQRSGRGFRLSHGKKKALIIDTYDKGHPMTKKHSDERAKIVKMRLGKEVIRVKNYKDILHRKKGSHESE